MAAKKSLLLLLACLLAAPVAAPAQETPAKFGAIITFRDDVDFTPFRRSYAADDRAAANPAAWSYLDRGVAGAVQALERAHGFRSDHVYSATVRGFAALVTAEQIATLAGDPRVLRVEADTEAQASAQSIPWGIDRIDADLSSSLAGDGSGAVTDVNVYVLDSGVDASHPDLNVVQHVNFALGPNWDCNGHGTHVAGTIAARDNDIDVVGVAPGAPITAVRVLGCGGFAPWSVIIKGVDWVTANAVRPAIANMSIVGGINESVDEAVRRSAASGVLYTISAGNNASDACNTSPGRSGAGIDNGIVNLAATDIDDQEADFSNFGACIDLWGPGVRIPSTRNGGGTILFSGTSMAAPHAAGTAVLYLSAHPRANPVLLEKMLRSAAVPTGTASKDGRPIELVHAAGF
ncbi:MAG TPA: S8 family serine peptidase [Thermoanaerobaculia bacterium]|nr:S8 family serine peptidase [Thermoanaerobaculia bacterium]